MISTYVYNFFSIFVCNVLKLILMTHLINCRCYPSIYQHFCEFYINILITQNYL